MFYLEENISLKWGKSGIMVGFTNGNGPIWYDHIQGNWSIVIY